MIILICLVSFPSDWSCIASLCVLAFGTNRGELKKQAFWLVFYVAIYAAVYFFAIDRVYGLLQMGVVLALPVIRLYNGRARALAERQPRHEVAVLCLLPAAFIRDRADHQMTEWRRVCGK